MANNVAQLTTFIQNDLSSQGVSATQILYELKATIREYENIRFWFNEKHLTVTISSTNTYALSLWGTVAATGAEIIEVDSLFATINSNTYELDEVNWDEWRALTSTTTLTGDPSVYAIFDEKVYLYPTPSTAGTATMAAHVKYAEITSQSSSNVWTDQGRELVRCATEKRIHGRLLKDVQMAQVMAAAERDALAALQRRSNAATTHYITPYL